MQFRYIAVENIVRKGETACNNQFLLFSKCFLTYMALIFHFKCCLQFVSIWTGLKFCCLVKRSLVQRDWMGLWGTEYNKIEIGRTEQGQSDLALQSLQNILELLDTDTGPRKHFIEWQPFCQASWKSWVTGHPTQNLSKISM